MPPEASDPRGRSTPSRDRDPGSLLAPLLAWLPLAGSWLLMACEIPALSAVIARLANPEIELAAYGSVIYPLVLIIEAPIIMLLAASTALSRDGASYRELRRFCNRSGALLTALHLLIALTPIYDLVVRVWIGAPDEVADAARVGLVALTPWTWAIAYRRFNQGVLIRFGQSRAVTVGTLLRLAANLGALGLGWAIGSLRGATLAAIAVSLGVVVEMIYTDRRVRPIVKTHLSHDDPDNEPLRGRAFWRFYVPLALTPIISLLAQPLSSAAVARMPEVLVSLAVVPVVLALVFVFQAMGLALSEVVIARLDHPNSARSLWRFSTALAAFVGACMILVATPPASKFWFGTVSGLSPELVVHAQTAIVLGIPTPFLRVLQSWYSGVLVHARQTQAISESVVAFLLVAGVVLSIGIVTGRYVGAHVAIAALSIGRAVQVMWLWWRSRLIVRGLLDTPPVSA